MLLYVLRIATLCSLAGGLTLLLRRKIEVTLSISMVWIVLVLYIAGLAGNLLYGLYLLFAMGAVALVYIAARLPRLPKGFWHEQLLTPGFAVFMVAAAILPLATRGRMLINWDEYSHWGLAAKNLYLLDTLSNSPASTIQLLSYPPGITLLQYFFTRLSPAFSEAALFQARNLLMVTLLLPAMQGISWKSWKYAPFFLTLVLLPYVFCNDPYVTLFVDALLGLAFANLLYHHFSAEGTSPGSVIPLCAATVLLALLKESGIAIALLGMIVIASDVFWGGGKAQRKSGVIRLCAVLGSMLAALASWKLFLAFSGYAPQGAGSAVLSTVQNLLAGSAPQYQYEVIKGYVLQLLAYDSPSGFTTMASLVSVSVLLMLFGLTASKRLFEGAAKRVWVLAGALFLVYCIFAGSLLGMYLFHFTQTEALRFASYDRYMGAMVLGVFGLLGMLLFHDLSNKREWRGHAVLLLFVVMFVPGIVSIAFSYTVDRPALAQQRQTRFAPFVQAATVTANLDPAQDKVFVVSQQNTGYDYWVLHYLFTPVKTQPADLFWSVAVDPQADDPNTKAMDADAFAALLLADDYRYVYLFHLDDAFRRDYASLFPAGEAPAEDVLYKVEKDAQGSLLLTRAS